MKFTAYKKTGLIATFVIVFLTVFLVPHHAFALSPIKVTPAFEVLSNTSADTVGGQVKGVWQQLTNVINYLIIALLIFVAFAQILRINVNTYGVKKILPALLLAIIAANFSFLFCRLLVDLANIVLNLFLQGKSAADNVGAGFNGLNTWANPDNFDPPLREASGGTIFWFVFAQLFVIAGAIITLILSYLFFIRLWLIYFLVALAPIAFMATVLPATKAVFNQWWSNFAKWVFLPVVSIFWLWLGNQWLASVNESDDYIMSYVFAGICYYLAITTPFKMGGVVMQAWGNFGKGLYKNKATGWAWGKAKEKWVDPYIKYQKDRLQRWYMHQGSQGAWKYNPLGIIARRSEVKAVEREKAAEFVDYARSTLRRDAHGGKEYAKKDKDGNEMRDEKGNLIMVPMFRSREWQLKKAKEWNEAKADAGEMEWMEKHFENLYQGTPEGIAMGGAQAARRGLAYRMRMSTADNEAKSIENIFMTEAFSKGAKNPFRTDTSYGIIKDDTHWENMRQLYTASKGKLESTNLMAMKQEGDKTNDDFLAASGANMIVRELRKTEQEIKKLRESGADTTKQEKHYAALEKKWGRAMKKVQDNDTLFDKSTGQFTNDAILLKQMLFKNGSFVGNDHAKANSLVSIWGMSNAPEEMQDMLNSRLRKRNSILQKEEYASEAAKRISVESHRRMMKTPRFKKILKELLTDSVSLTDRETKDVAAYLKNALVTAGHESSSEIYSDLIRTLKEAITETSDEDVKLGGMKNLKIISSQLMKNSLSQSINLQDSMRKAAETQLAAETEAKRVRTGKKDDKLTDEEEYTELQRLLQTDEGFREETTKHLRERLANMATMSAQKLGKIDIKLDKRGGLDFEYDMSNIDELADTLSELGEKMAIVDARDRFFGRSSAKQAEVNAVQAVSPTSRELGTSFQDSIEKCGIDE